MKKQKMTLLLLMAAMMVPGTMQAKKIKYGQSVLYNGEVKRDIPTGKGTLTTKIGSISDVLTGNFGENGTVTDAQLTFPSGWKFTGTLSYEIADGGSQLTYILTEGELYVISASIYKSNVHDFTTKITPEDSITFVRYPRKNGNNLETAYVVTKVPGTVVNDDLIKPLSISMFGDKSTSTVTANCTILLTSEVIGTSGAGTDVQQNLQSKGFTDVREPWSFLIRPIIIEMADGTIISEGEDGSKKMWMVQSTNGNVFSYTVEGNTSAVNGIAKQFTDGGLGYINMEAISKGWVVNYADKSKLQGTFFLKSGNGEITNDELIQKHSVIDIFNTIMKAPSLESLHIRPYTATLTKDGTVIAEYKNGSKLKK